MGWHVGFPFPIASHTDRAISNPLLVFDNKGRLIAIFSGRPVDPKYASELSSLRDELLDIAVTYKWQPYQLHHRRGDYATLNLGTSHGHGSTKPFRFANPGDEGLASDMLRHPTLRRIALYQSYSLQSFAPRLFDKYKNLEEAIKKEVNIEPHFSGSAFPASGINFGPRVMTKRHKDLMNLAPGFCFVTCLSKHNHLKGGHLILWEYGIFIPFPHASTVGIPSAIVTHSNLPIGKDEVRCSFTQYGAGALFRWLDNQCRTDTRIPHKELGRIMERRFTYFKRSLKTLTTISEHIEM